MITGINSPQKASLNAAQRSAPLAFFMDPWMLFFLASIITTMTKARPIRIPGTIPPMNISAMETPVMEA